MTKMSDHDSSSFLENVIGRLEVFADQWRHFVGTEQAGAQQFLHQLLEIYEVEYTPGTIFEQHPIRLPARRPTRNGNLFGDAQEAQYSTERMDMFLPKVCVWEMKAPGEKDLQRHHDQILAYWARVRTRFMVLCNFREIWIFDTEEEQGQLAPSLRITLDELPGRADALLFLRGETPDLLGRSERVTAEAARVLGRIVREQVEASREPDRDRDRAAKLVLQCVFAMFAEDTELIPPRLFTDAIKRADVEGSLDPVWALFADFGTRSHGEKSHAFAPYVNGPLFDRSQPRLALTDGQIHDLYCAARDYDWQDVRPEIFGSIFEQALNPVERHELGAHFTREADIARVVVPTVIRPWQERIASLRMPKDAERAVADLKAFHVLDPACGCGNFLYVAYREMKRIEAALAEKWLELQRKVAKRRADIQPPPPRPWFTIEQLHGIELNPFAAFLARVVLWIGEHLAARELGLDEQTLPLKSLDHTVRHADALLIDWPRPEGVLAIVGNPPYLGVRKLRHELGDDYVEQIFTRYPANRAADYVTYWFTRALKVLRPDERAGYVCTNSVAQNESREASIDRIVARGGSITDAWKSYPWPGEAAVHIGIVNWVMAPYDGIRMLDGKEVATISPALTSSTDATVAKRIHANDGLCFMGVTPGNAGFVLTDEQRAEILAEDPQSEEVIRPFLIGRDVNREVEQKPSRWIIDFGMTSKEEAEKFVGAMRHVRKYVYPIRKNNRRESRAKLWWRFAEPAPNLRDAIERLEMVTVIPRVSPHLTVTRQSTTVCFDCQLMVLALTDYYHFGLLQSAVHETWAWARGSTLKGDLRYTNTTIFETFPFPPLPDGGYGPRLRPASKTADRLAHSAEAFDRQRWVVCREAKLGLTKIHNQLKKGEPEELRKLYDAMNDAVCASYGWPEEIWRDQRATLERLVALNRDLAPLGRLEN